MEHTTEHFWTSWPWPLTYDLDLWTWPRYPSTWRPCQISSLYVSPFSRESETDGHTDTHTQTMPKLLHPTRLRDVGCNKTGPPWKWLENLENDSSCHQVMMKWAHGFFLQRQEKPINTLFILSPYTTSLHIKGCTPIEVLRGPNAYTIIISEDNWRF